MLCWRASFFSSFSSAMFPQTPIDERHMVTIVVFVTQGRSSPIVVSNVKLMK
jgi:hypothetical protein